MKALLARTNPRDWVLTSDQITFDTGERPSSASAATRFRIRSVVGAGPSHIDEDTIDFADLDAALLEVDATSKTGAALPAPLTLSNAFTSTDRGRELFVIGYPARPIAAHHQLWRLQYRSR